MTAYVLFDNVEVSDPEGRLELPTPSLRATQGH
jgi:hypothetical protein